ncbi:MAG: hypothetical protein ABW277_10545 [Longimicrobiaceae bacterium]
MPCNPAVRGSLLPVAAALVWTLPAGAQQPPGPQPRAEPPGAAAAVPAASSGGSAPASYPGEEARLGQLAGKLEASDRTTSDGTAYDDWLYQGRAGERLTIIMRSGSLDTYLRFGRLVGDRFTQIETDDDGAGGTDSRCDVTLPAAGVYVIRANTLFAGFGDYVLEVRRR